jgi:RHS repeat-associated protein
LPATVKDGTGYSTSTSSFPFSGLLDTSGSTGGPKAFLNWLIFDRNYTLVDGGYSRLSNTPREYGQNVAHEMLSGTVTIREPGFMYVYLSNEEPTGAPIDVYFDDFKVTQVHSKIVAGGDYYPFGLPMDTRQGNEERYRFGYQGQFAEMDSLTNWNTFELRMYDARFGRWLTPDPYGQFDSPYVGMGNNPVGGVDPDGGWILPISAELLKYLSTTTILPEVVVTGLASLTTSEFVKAAFHNIFIRDLPGVLGDRMVGSTTIANGFVQGNGIPVNNYGGDSKLAENLRFQGQATGVTANVAVSLLSGGGNPTLGGSSSLAVSNPGVVVLQPSVTAPIISTTYVVLAGTAEDLNYRPSDKHKKGGHGTEMDLDDATAELVLKKSILGSSKARYGWYNGKLYEFRYDNAGGWHGYPIKGLEAPTRVLREMLSKNWITMSEYMKLITGKL